MTENQRNKKNKSTRIQLKDKVIVYNRKQQHVYILYIHINTSSLSLLRRNQMHKKKKKITFSGEGGM